MLDFVFILILTMSITMILPRSKDMGAIGDFVGDMIICTIIYVIFKALPHYMIGGWTFPLNPDPTIHAISGTIAFALCWGLFGIIILRKRRSRSPEPSHE
jgi:hypothetical protein